jgi:hypothetical protein
MYLSDFDYAGVLMALWSAVGVLFMSDRETQMAPGIPGVAAVLGALIGVFARRATAKERRHWILSAGSPSVELGFLRIF